MKLIRHTHVKSTVTVAVLGVLVGLGEVCGQCTGHEFQKLTASDASSGKEFGRHVCIDENVAVCGSRLDSVGAGWTGSVYVYEFDGTTWNELAKLTASDGAFDDQLGLHVALSGDVIVAGARNDDDHGADSGSAYLFVKPPGGWTNMTETAKLTASDSAAGDQFGSGVAVSGDTVAVAAVTDEGGIGSVYVFEKPPGGWASMTETAKLMASDGVPGDNLGNWDGLGIDDEVIVAGAGNDDDHGASSGSAYVFVKPPAGWTDMSETAKLTASDAAAEDYFGASVRVSGDVIVVGAGANDDDGSRSGSAYVFMKPAAGWVSMTETAKLTASDAEAGDGFGERVDVSGEVCVVAARYDDDGGFDAGAAYVYQFNGAIWSEAGKFVVSDADSQAYLGSSISVSGSWAIIGTDFDDHAGSKSGSAYILSGLSDCNENGILDHCDIANGGSQDCNGNGLPDDCDIVSTSAFFDVSSWSAFDYSKHCSWPDCSSPRGYLGAVFDDRYIYFAPQYAIGEVLRYDTTQDFGDAVAWSTFDATNSDPPKAKGRYRGAVFDGRYVYFAPYHWHGEVLRYDTTGGFADGSAWATFDAKRTNPPGAKGGYVGAVFDSRYVYFVPESSPESGQHGEVLRYDTAGSFSDASSWSTFEYRNHCGSECTNPAGYCNGVFDGRYVYFAPYAQPGVYHCEVLRYDTNGGFTEVSSWSTFDPGSYGVGSDPGGFTGAMFDGRYVYFSPQNANAQQICEVLRYDIRGQFSDVSSWTTFDPCKEGLGYVSRNFWPGGFDNRYIYFAPNDWVGGVMRYDTRKDFGDLSSWSAFDAGVNGVGEALGGYCSAAFDNRFMYFAPYLRQGNQPYGEVLRYDTWGEDGDCNANSILDECESDVDTDGIIDDCDNCPLDPNADQLDSDQDGSGDACDACPTDPNKTQVGICGCGVADTDSDGDGTADCNDGCPNNPEKTQLGVCGCETLECASLNVQIIETIPAPGYWRYEVGGLAWDGTYLWAVTDNPDRIHKLDPASGQVLLSCGTPREGCHGLEWASGELWTGSASAGVLSVLSSTCSELRSFPSPFITNPSGFAWDGVHIWSCSEYGEICKFDPVTGLVECYPAPRSHLRDLAWDGTYLWASGGTVNKLFVLDPTTVTVACEVTFPNPIPTNLPGGAGPWGLAWDGSYLWSSTGGGNSIYKLLVTCNASPVANCRESLMKAADDTCQAAVTPEEIDDGSFDPDLGDTLRMWLEPEPSGPYRLGTTPVKLWVTDDKSDPVACDSTIIVTDQSPPVIICPPNVTVLVTCPDAPVTDPEHTGWATATDNCDPDPVLTYQDVEMPDLCLLSKTIQRTWIAADASTNPASCQQTIEVVEDDRDGDGICDCEDSCPDTPGRPEYQGCPVADLNIVELHIVDQAKRGDCDGPGSCRRQLADVEIRVFDRNNADFQSTYGTKNPDGGIYNQVFENDIGRIASCTTDATGQCYAGEEAVGDYLVIVKYPDVDTLTATTQTVYAGKPKSPSDFVDTDGDGVGDLATKEFQIIKVIRKNGTIEIGRGSKTVLTGSYLEIVAPEYAVWDEGVTSYVYPFIFNSDSMWEVDVCAEVPEGYQIVGVYDENGDLVASAECVQTIVAGEAKVVAFEVVDLQSPPPHLKAMFKIKHKGKLHKFDLDTPGHRVGKDKPTKKLK